jgi:signal transduction histidine kinase
MRTGRRFVLEHPYVADTTFAVVLAAIGLAEVWSGGGGAQGRMTLAVALMTLPLGARRRVPVLVVAVVMGAGAALVGPNDSEPGVLVLAMLTAVYSVGAHASRRAGLVGVSLAIGLACVSAGRAGGGAGNYLFVGGIVASAWFAGVALRERRSRAAELERHAEALERDQEARARVAVADERARIARDLHDVVAHSMSVIAVQAGAERLALPDDARQTREVLAGIEHTARQGLVEMRRLVELLRQQDEELALAPQPSVARLDVLVQQVCDAGMPVELCVEGQPAPLPPGVDLSAYRIVQEALTNALKHAGPAQARVTLRYCADRLELEVADNGGGVDGNGGGHGLIGMKERVAVFGGVLEAGRTGAGYRLRATLPLQPPAS